MNAPVTFNGDIVTRLANAWVNRATVRSNKFFELEKEDFDLTRPDYPSRMVPFWNHPKFVTVDDQTKQNVLSWGWIVYNERTIAAEERVANPAFVLLQEGRFPVETDYDLRRQIQQSLIDEHFHSLMHMTAIEKTRQFRGIEDRIKFPNSITYRRLQEAQANAKERWERDLLVLIFAVVSEISVNAYLELMAKDDTIQPMHTVITQLHNRDEYAHASLLVEIGKSVYSSLDATQQAMFIRALPKALFAFMEQDYSAWEIILNYLRVPHTREILEDCKAIKGNSQLSRDYSGLKKLVRHLNIETEVGFAFEEEERFPLGDPFQTY